ncbi:FAD-binding oxidoreductase [Elioraea rosea]|uniref:FAD-binding oxidoreductase n=1 Tax=Elioraea rosea TaxID=2492390 RepID=UPI001183E207|nr:FAD-binding oxidoreductase [Elioraea rosea]
MLPMLAAQAAPGADQALVSALAGMVGAGNVLADFPDRLAASRDRAPIATFAFRDGLVPGVLPRAVVRPGSREEVARVLAWANANDVPVIPYGAGSGVLGGAIPLGGEIALDLKRLNRLVAINATDGLATVEAGMNGGRFEAAVEAEGFTCGHLPQSLHMSTVGGWLACRGAGQNSTRYGKIEDMVVGLCAVLADGTEVEVRPAARRSTGPSLRDVFVGCEGTLGVITEATLRIWKRPEAELPLVLSFPDIAAGLEAGRRILQAELRPSVFRLYDETETVPRVKELADFGKGRVLAILVFSGIERLAALERDLAGEIAAALGARAEGDAPYRHWLAHRFESYSPPWQASGHFMDTCEVTGAWSALVEMYSRMREAILDLCPAAHFGAHWSHAYPEGACQYMTVRLPPMPRAEGLALHARAWDLLQTLTVVMGGSIAHHHGAGLLRGPWMAAELGAGGAAMLQRIKDALDPGNILNPGKLGLRPRASAARVMGEG